MGEIIQLLTNWQTLIGSAMGAIIAIGGSYYITSKRLKSEKEKDSIESYQTM